MVMATALPGAATTAACARHRGGRRWGWSRIPFRAAASVPSRFRLLAICHRGCLGAGIIGVTGRCTVASSIAARLVFAAVFRTAAFSAALLVRVVPLLVLVLLLLRALRSNTRSIIPGGIAATVATAAFVRAFCPVLFGLRCATAPCRALPDLLLCRGSGVISWHLLVREDLRLERAAPRAREYVSRVEPYLRHPTFRFILFVFGLLFAFRGLVTIALFSTLLLDTNRSVRRGAGEESTQDGNNSSSSSPEGMLLAEGNWWRFFLEMREGRPA